MWTQFRKDECAHAICSQYSMQLNSKVCLDISPKTTDFASTKPLAALLIKVIADLTLYRAMTPYGVMGLMFPNILLKTTDFASTKPLTKDV